MSYDSALKRLPDPTTNPAGPGFITQQLVPMDPGMLHPLNTGATIGVYYEGNYWTSTITYPSLTRDQGDVIIPFLMSLRGSFENFYISLPTKTNPKTGAWVSNGSFAGDLSVSGTDDRQLLVDNIATFGGGTLSPGDLIKLSNSHKVYMVTAINYSGFDWIVDLSSPILNKATIASASLWANDVKLRVRLNGQFNPPNFTADGLYDSFSIQLRENIL